MYKALCIEDNAVNLLVLERALGSNGFTVLHAITAEQGIEMARKHTPDIILMDIGLPGMDGLTATRHIKADAELRHIPVVAVTASGIYGPEECRLAGCDNYVHKPITLSALLEVVTLYCPQPARR